jgi:NADH:ubiquinone oxidoreductase subunit 4 (subunit M)
MRKIGRIATAILLAAIGVGITFFNTYALLQGGDLITTIAYGSLIVMGLGFVVLGWAVLKGESVKTLIRDLFIGM